MVSGTPTKIRKVIEPQEFKRILREKESFLLHLTSNVGSPTFFQSLSKLKKLIKIHGAHPFDVWLQSIDLDFYEMKMSDAVDIMIEFGYTTEWIIHNHVDNGKNVTIFREAVLIINKGQLFYNSQHDCYCPDVVLENVLRLNPDLVIIPD